MAPPSYERVKDVFLAACRLPMPQRASFLGQACAGDEALHSEVAVLLEHDSALAGLGDVPLSGQAGFVGVRRPQPVMEASSLVDPRSATGSPHIPSPERVGRYRILGVLGCGGMAVVYRAEQDRPRREVALKLIRPGIPTHQLLRRFEHEAQVLGRLHHPGIAQIFEAGCADSPEGPQPFFAMELIDGQPLTSYADENRLAPRERLSLLAQVCDAVQAAHQKGVIHRDLKPSNILVDRAGQPRILDFGVARTTDADVLLATLHTEVGAVVGTLPYMSPEQAAGDPHELDTRADVYALGVIAFELLAGRLPHELCDKSLAEALAIIREREAPRLSAGAARFRGDLETIVGKALAKEKARRYASASELATDVRRYLRDEPILARPPSVWYQVHKFARRNRAFVLGGVATVLALVAGIIGTAWEAARATRQRDAARAAGQLAEARLGEAQMARAAEADARRAAERDATTARQIQDFLANMLKSADPRVTAGREVTVRELLDQAAARVATDLAAQPDVQTDVRGILGATFLALGQIDPALEQFNSALALAESTRGGAHRDTLKLAANVAVVLKERGQLAEAEKLLRRAWDGLARLDGPDGREPLQTQGNLANVLRAARRFDEAEALLRQTLDTQQRVLGETDIDVLTSLTNLAKLYYEQRRWADAEPLVRRALLLHEQVTPADHPDRLLAMNNLGQVLVNLRRLDEAEPLLRDCYAAHRRVLGDEHPNTLTAANGVCNLLIAQENWPEAEPLARMLVAERGRLLGETHPATIRSLGNLRRVLEGLGRTDEATQLAQRIQAARGAQPASGPAAGP